MSKGVICKELAQGPSRRHGSFQVWSKVGSRNTGWTRKREICRVHKEAYRVSSLAAVAAFP